MRNKKIITMLAALALVGVVGAGSTLAYLTDTTETVQNTFTVGNVDIEVVENYEKDSLLMPVYGDNGKVKKEVGVNNTGKNDAYVRVFIAIPNAVDDGDPGFKAVNNRLHFNYGDKNTVYNWTWNDSLKDDAKWNYFEQKIDGVLYDVYVVTYKDVLKAGEETTSYAMNQVYLDKSVTSAEVAEINKTLGQWKILVAAQAVQADNFPDAFTAFANAYDTNKTDGTVLASNATPFKGEVTKAYSTAAVKNVDE